ncbi:iron-containing redox enzyme family protein [Massilia sp. W12]|uniref:iron-containing redox enzyme family protein n=1 Tax=Massilia sp. W12 TaxID=3126507 RepID=UPI0030CC0401
MQYPILRSGAALIHHPETSKTHIALNGLEVAVSGFSHASLEKFLLAMNGNEELEKLIHDHAMAPEATKAIIRDLQRLDLIKVLDKPCQLTISPSDFAAACRNIFPIWKKNVFHHDFWVRLTDGSASRTEFMGWLLENFYFIEGATIRLSAVSAACKHKKMRQHFSKHFTEEYNHHHFFMKALKLAGMTEQQVRQHNPLPSTMAIMNHMRECARRDPISYAACSAFLESTGENRVSSMQFFDLLSKHFDTDKIGIIKPLVDHAHLDEDYGHNDWLEKICAELPVLEMERANQALQSARTLVEHLSAWSDDMQKHYGAKTLEEALRPHSFRQFN